MKKFLLALFGFIFVNPLAYSYPVYLKQVIYNHTPFEIYFGMRPYYKYPNWSCQGAIPAYSMSVCHDQYDNENNYFWLQIISAYAPAKFDHSVALRIPALLYAPQAEIVWNIDYNAWSNDYRFDFKVY